MIPLGTVIAGYALARAIASVPVGIILWRGRQHVAVNVAQGLSDLSAVLFLLGLTSPEMRTSGGLWWVVLFLYAMIWESVQFYNRLQDFQSPPVGDTPLNSIEAGWGTLVSGVWQVVGIAMPLAAGFGLAFDAAAPNQLTFPQG
jgi:hypothetical protein